MKKLIKRSTAVLIAASMMFICPAAYVLAESEEPDIKTLKAAMETAREEMEEAAQNVSLSQKFYQDQKAIYDQDEAAAQSAETAADNAEQALDDAIASIKENARSTYNQALEASNNAENEYDEAQREEALRANAVTAAEEKTERLEGEISELENTIREAEEVISALPNQIEEKEGVVESYTSAWEQDKAEAAAALEEAQAAYDRAGREFINQKINELNGYDLEEMTAICKTYSSVVFSPVAKDTDGNTYASVADAANSPVFEKLVDQACSYENLKKSIGYIRETNDHRALPVHNAEALKVSYQLMGTAIMSGAIAVFKTGHFLMRGSEGWKFWKSGNSWTSGENLAYSSASSERGWDPYHGWYYKERMGAIANESGIDVNESIVNSVLAESQANGYPYDPFGAPWYQTMKSFINGMQRDSSTGDYVTGHYDSIVDNDFKATGVCYICAGRDLITMTTAYPCVASQEFNGDTSTSVTVDDFEDELDAWFEDVASALENAQERVNELKDKPEALVKAENELQNLKAELRQAQEDYDTAAEALKGKQAELVNAVIEKTNAETAWDAAKQTLARKQNEMETAHQALDAAEAEKEAAEAIDKTDPETYADYGEVAELAEEAADKKADAQNARSTADESKSQADAAKKLMDAAIRILDEKTEAYETAKETYERAADLKNAIITIDDQIYTGEPLTPEPDVQMGSRTLVKGEHYEAEYRNNTNAGTATVIITALEESDYIGSKSVTFKITQKEADSITIYRLYNPKTKEHLWTSSSKEYSVLPGYGWKQEGTAWHAPTKGQGVYRLYNKKSGDHHYTSSQNEAKVLTTQYGWTYDNNRKPVFYSGGSKPIYRLYNNKFKVGAHHLTMSRKEYDTLPKYGWIQEGIALKCVK